MALARGLIGYAPAVIIPRLVTLLQVTLLTRLIAPAEFGTFVLLITVGDALDALCCNWIRVVLGRFGAGQSRDTLAEEAGRAVIQFVAVTLVVALPAAAVTAFSQHVEALPFFLCLAAYLVTNGTTRLALTVLSVRGRKMPFFLVEAVRTIGGFVGVMALAWSGTTTHYAPLMAAMNVAAAVAAVIGLTQAFRGLGFRRPHNWALDRANYILPLLAGTAVGVMLASSDRFVIEAFAGPAALATYAASVMLARQPLEFLFSVVNVRTFPELMATFETEGPKAAGERMGDLLSIMALLTCPAAIGLALVAEPLAATFLTPAYVGPARFIIPLGAMAGLMIGFKTFVFDQVLHMRKAIWGNTLMVLPVMLIGVVLSGFLASRIGGVGCVIGLLVQSALALAVSVGQAVRLLPIVPHRADLARIGLMCAAMTVAVSAALAVLADFPAAVRLVSAVAVGGGSYAAAGLALKPGPVRDLLPVRIKAI